MESSSTQPANDWLQWLGLRWILRLVASSIGRKLVMACTGLLLCGFLVGHLAGNMLLFSGEHAFNKYAYFLHEQEWLPLAEVSLFVLFVAHIYLAFVTAGENARARNQQYAVKRSKLPRGILKDRPSNWMFLSGSVVLGFLLLHLADLRFELRPDLRYDKPAASAAAPVDVTQHDPTHKTPYEITKMVLSGTISRAVYLIGAIALGFHLSHGFASAFQTLGLSHPKYTRLVQWLSYVFAWMIALGFGSIALLVPSIR